MAVFPVEEGTLVGFVHGEDHFKARGSVSLHTSLSIGAWHWHEHCMHVAQECDNLDGCAWKTIGVCHSSDYGRTWTLPEPIISSPNQRPGRPQFGGCGDFCVVKVCVLETLTASRAVPDMCAHCGSHAWSDTACVTYDMSAWHAGA